MGKFKFIFDNESSIYLHDTPNRTAFNSSYRAVSHGCVRVFDPLLLCTRLVNDTNRLDVIRMEVGLPPHNPKNADRYAKLLQKRAKPGFELHPTYVGLKQDMLLFIDYYTCWPNQDNHLVFYADIYHKDADLQRAMGNYLRHF